MMKLSMPKFHDKTSLYLGCIAGFLLVASGLYGLWKVSIPVASFQIAVGAVLGVHCLDTLRYYKKHRIIRVVKTPTSRVIYTEIKKPVKLVCAKNAIKTAWAHKPFRLWIILCTVGIIVGLFVGIGMTNLVILVAIACLGWAMETANTSIEILLDIVHPDYSDKVKIVKDMFAVVPMFVYSAYVVSWLILVAPSLYERIFG